MSGMMNMVSRFTRGRGAAVPTRGRKPAATRGAGRVGTPAARGRGGAASVEGTARRFLKRAR